MQDKIGMALDDIHLTGHVPQCELFLKQILLFFFRLLSVGFFYLFLLETRFKLIDL